MFPVVLTTQRRPSPKSVYMYPEKNLKCLVSNHKDMVPNIITSKEQILATYSDVFDGIGCFPGPPYHIQVNPSVTPKQIPCQPVQVHLKESFKNEIDKDLTNWSVEACSPSYTLDQQFCLSGGNKLGNLKLRICLDPANLNKAIVWEPYHFKTTEDIANCLQKPA